MSKSVDGGVEYRSVQIQELNTNSLVTEKPYYPAIYNPAQKTTTVGYNANNNYMYYTAVGYNAGQGYSNDVWATTVALGSSAGPSYAGVRNFQSSAFIGARCGSLSVNGTTYAVGADCQPGSTSTGLFLGSWQGHLQGNTYKMVVQGSPLASPLLTGQAASLHVYGSASFPHGATITGNYSVDGYLSDLVVPGKQSLNAPSTITKSVVSCTNGPYTLTLPAITSTPVSVFITNSDGLGDITVIPSGTDKIEGNNSVVIPLGSTFNSINLRSVYQSRTISEWMVC